MLLSSDASSKLFKLKNDTFAATIIDQVDPEVWKIKSKIEAKGENLLHFCINEGFRLSASALLTTDHPHSSELVFERNKNQACPLMSSLKQNMGGVNQKIWEVMLKKRGEKMWEDMLSQSGGGSSRLGQILLLCAQNEEDELLLNILEDLQSKNTEQVCELVFERSGERRTILDTCKDQKTVIKILKLLDIKNVEERFLDLDKKDKNVLNHWARSNFHQAIDHLHLHLSKETFKKMLLQKSSNGNNPLMVSALHSNKECLDTFLAHICLYRKSFYKDDLDGILHDKDKFGDNILALVLQQPGTLDAAKNILLDLEMKQHGVEAKDTTDRDKQVEDAKKELTECLRQHLQPSVEVQKALNDIDNSLPKGPWKKAGILVRVLLKSFLVPVVLLALDIFFDAILVRQYRDFDESELGNQYDICRAHEKGETIEKLGTNNTTYQGTVCERNLSSAHPFVCIPLALKGYPRFNYSLAFVISPWIFYWIEYCQSPYWEESVEVGYTLPGIQS